MSNLVHLDFETQSTQDLTSCGADIYCRHPSTKIMATAWAFGDKEVRVNKIFQSPDQDLVDHVAGGGLVAAWNAMFEWLCWNYSWKREFPELPELKLEQLRCVMAESYAMGMPGKLEKAAPALGLSDEKDMRGYRVMLQLSQPRELNRDGSFVWWDPIEHKDKYERMYLYNGQDVVVERKCHKRLMRLSVPELEMWQLDAIINQRGVRADIPAAIAALDVVALENKRLNEEMRKVTCNAVTTYSANAQLTNWIRSKGVETDGVAKSDVTDLLEIPTLPEDVYHALEIRRDANKSSTAKFNALINRSEPETQRLRSTLQYHGAGTGRWAARGFQLHNLPRPKLSQQEIEGIFNVLSS